MNGSRLAAAMIVVAASLWGLIGPAAILAERAGLPAAGMAFWRAALAALLFVILARGRLLRVPGSGLAGTALFGALGVGAMYGTSCQSVSHNAAALAASLLYTGPVWVAA